MKNFKRKLSYKLQTEVLTPIALFRTVVAFYHALTSLIGFVVITGFRMRNKRKKEELHSLDEVRSWNLELKMEILQTASWNLNKRASAFVVLESANSKDGRVDVDYFFKDCPTDRHLKQLNRLFRSIIRQGNPIFEPFLAEVNRSYERFEQADKHSQWEDLFFEHASELYNEIPEEERVNLVLCHLYSRGEILPFWVPKLVENLAAEKEMYAKSAREIEEYEQNRNPELANIVETMNEKMKKEQEEREQLMRRTRQYGIRSGKDVRISFVKLAPALEIFKADCDQILNQPITGKETLELVYTDDNFDTIHVLQKGLIVEDTVSTPKQRKQKNGSRWNRWATWQIEKFDELPRPENQTIS